MDQAQIATQLHKKHVLVTGGTGSFGKEIVRELLTYEPASVTVLSRDEKKQYDMQHLFVDPRLRFALGDVRDLNRLREVFSGMDIVFHAAALKQVPNCEYSPSEAVRTNVLGAENVRRAAIESQVQSVIAISTDKAVKPVNVMGMSKAIQERIMLQPTTGRSTTRFVCVRYGNVLGSRGSVVPLFHHYISTSRPLPISHPLMTRFQLTLPHAVQLVLWSLLKGEPGDLWVRKMPSSRIVDLARVLAHGLTGRADYPQVVIGARPGEKMHEVLVSEEEMWRARELKDYFVIPSWANSQGGPGPKEGSFSEYSSNTVRLLSDDELHVLLERDGWFRPRDSSIPHAWEV